jgi:hypothetical protein
MKKILTVIICLVLSLSFPLTCFASTLPKTNNNSVIKPMISTWHYQNTTPLVGLDWHYTVFRYGKNKSLALGQNISKAGLVGLCSVLEYYVPKNPIAIFISNAIFYEILNNHSLDTPTLYLEEYSWGLDDSPDLNYEVDQYWYADAAHTKYITATRYFVSFY